jgi:hypothetical protein
MPNIAKRHQAQTHPISPWPTIGLTSLCPYLTRTHIALNCPTMPQPYRALLYQTAPDPKTPCHSEPKHTAPKVLPDLTSPGPIPSHRTISLTSLIMPYPSLPHGTKPCITIPCRSRPQVLQAFVLTSRYPAKAHLTSPYISRAHPSVPHDAKPNFTKANHTVPCQSIHCRT